jgi:hypothetical protein
MTKKWFSLLLAQRERSVGLTIPFVIGAMRDSADTAPTDEGRCFSELVLLLEEMRDQTPESHLVKIAECTTLIQPVAALYPASSRFNRREAVPSPKDGRVSLYVQTRYRCDGTIDPVADHLWQEFRNEILGRRFSFKNGTYVPFDEADERFIARALKK